jgi:Tol biopolymer transport system component
MELSWYDRKGSRLSVAGTEAEYNDPELSPDGKFVAFARGTPGDIWTLDIDKNVSSKWTTDPANDANPRWSPDGKIVAFDSARQTGSGIYQRAVGVSGADKLVFKSDSAKPLTLSDWSRDGKYMAYVQDNDVWALALPPDQSGDQKATDIKPIQVTKTAFAERLPRISPDNRWIAYVSNKSGRDEVYVQSFPEPGIEQQVSDAGAGGGGAIGGPQLRWSRDGKELYYYVTGPSRFMVVSVKPAGTSLNAAAPVILFPKNNQAPSASIFSVTNDNRFLLQLRPAATFGAGVIPTANAAVANPAAAAPVTVIVNWTGGRAR